MRPTSISRNRQVALGAEIKSGDSRSVLAALFRKMMIQNGITNDRFGLYMEDYLNDPRNKIPANTKARSSERGNTRKELLANKISWRTFVKGLRFQKISKADITVDYIDKYGSENSVTITIDLDEGSSDDAIANGAEAVYPKISDTRTGVHTIKLFRSTGEIYFKYIYDEQWSDIDVLNGDYRGGTTTIIERNL